MYPFEFAWYSTKSNTFHRPKKRITTRKEFDKAVSHRSIYGDACYRTVYRFEDFADKTTAIIDKIYIDLDEESDPQKAMDDAMEVSHYIGDHATLYFSGRKGFGMLLHCAPVHLIPSMKRAVLRQFTFDLINKLIEVETADHAVIGDINRVRRVVDTRHQVTGLYAIGIHRHELFDLTIDEVKAMATRPRGLVQTIHPSAYISQQLLDIEEMLLVEWLQRFVDKHMLAQSTFDGMIEVMSQHPESRNVVLEFIQSLDDEHQANIAVNAARSGSTNWWIEEASEKLRREGQLTNGKDRGKEHKARVHFVKYGHSCGMGFRELCNAFVNVVDGNGRRQYNKSMTESQVRSCIR